MRLHGESYSNRDALFNPGEKRSSVNRDTDAFYPFDRSISILIGSIDIFYL